MAEIKSTMEMVLARAEALCAEKTGSEDDSLRQDGMKIAASYLNGNPIDLSEELAKYNGPDFNKYAEGVLQTFLRNINLPRDDEKPWEKSVEGLLAVARVWPSGSPAEQLETYLAEVQSLLGRYSEHKKQLKKQLEEHFTMQIAHLEQSLAQQTGMSMKLSPSQHPKFQEEWQNTLGQMNDQYLNAIGQYKEAISQLFIG